MLRGIMALAWADSKVTDAERARLTEFLDNTRYLSDAQRENMKSYLVDQQDFDIDALWAEITDKQDRAQLIDTALSVFYADGDFSSSEHAIYEKLHSAHMASIDLKGLNKDLGQMAAEAKERLKQEEANYIESLKKDAGFSLIPGVNRAELLLYKVNKYLGNK